MLLLLLSHATTALKMGQPISRVPSGAKSTYEPALVGRQQFVQISLAAALSAFPTTGNAYDAIQTPNADFEELEKKRKARAAVAEANKKRVKPYLDAISSANDAKSFASAADNLALWIIGEGKLPEGLDAVQIRNVIQDAYLSLPKEQYYCEPTRTNQGICL